MAKKKKVIESFGTQKKIQPAYLRIETTLAMQRKKIAQVYKILDPVRFLTLH